jgi:hypothetical protein
MCFKVSARVFATKLGLGIRIRWIRYELAAWIRIRILICVKDLTTFFTEAHKYDKVGRLRLRMDP